MPYMRSEHGDPDEVMRILMDQMKDIATATQKLSQTLIRFEPWMLQSKGSKKDGPSAFVLYKQANATCFEITEDLQDSLKAVVMYAVAAIYAKNPPKEKDA